MCAELVAIHTVLTTFAAHELIGVFTDSLSSLEAIEHQNTNPGICGSHHSHHHMLLLESITELLDTMESMGYRTTLHTIRGHTIIRENDLADAAAKMAIGSFETLPPDQTIRMDVGKIAPRPNDWVMYTSKPPSLAMAPAILNSYATTHRPRWTIPEAERL
jgi:hypothetical protein